MHFLKEEIFDEKVLNIVIFLNLGSISGRIGSTKNSSGRVGSAENSSGRVGSAKKFRVTGRLGAPDTEPWSRVNDI